jgi:hypothetical protein
LNPFFQSANTKSAKLKGTVSEMAETVVKKLLSFSNRKLASTFHQSGQTIVSEI